MWGIYHYAYLREEKTMAWSRWINLAISPQSQSSVTKKPGLGIPAIK